ncbi:MAG: prephenate dehydrogenase/arogenate dehydrogenase family protein, partial [Chrysiogenales bacterium]
FRDTTRIASGSPEMWRDISAQNRGNIISAIDRMIGEMVAIKGLMAEERSSSNAVHDYLEEAKRARDGLS